MASASPEREREKGQREEDGAGGKICLCVLPSPRRWRLEVGRGEDGGHPGQARVSPRLLPVRCARELGP